MPSVTLKNQKGQEAGSLTLSDAVFGVELPNEFVVREVVNAWRSNQRQGTHATKTRGFVSGGGKKPWKQKHTGRARAGSSRSPLWRGGAIVFGPSPRDYREKTNRQKRQAAMRSALSALQAGGRLIAVDALDFAAEPKTKNVVAALDAVGANGTVLIVTKDVNAPLVQAARNLGWARTQVVNALCVYELLLADTTVITRDALAALEEMLA